MVRSPEYKRILHRMGYYDYQNGLIYRHINQEGGWDAHNSNCRKYILSVIDQLQPAKVTILGSGWLLDIPLAEIAEMTKTVDLVDIVHPADVREQLSAYSNVTLVEADVTGGLIAEVWNKTRHYSFFRKMRSLDTINIPEYRPAQDPGLVVSLNILTQLEHLPVEYLKKKTLVPEQEYDAFRMNIQKKHIDFLLQHNSVLITDTAECFTGINGDRSEVKSLRISIPDGKTKEEWTWDFDLKKSDYYRKKSVLKVTAITFTG